MAAKYEYDPNQELLALGVANVAGSFMGAYPSTGSFSRTAVNAMLGATSLFSCALSAWIVFLATYVLLPVIRYLPLAALAPIIIVGAIGVISMKDFKSAYGSSKTEFFVMSMTFAVPSY
jgi:MFS superfamily sulfate permease-like transporter